MRRLTLVMIPMSLCLLACTGDFFKSCTSKVVGTTVETTKEVTTGVAEGIEEGRKSGTSVDGAVLVSSLAELQAQGGLSVVGVEDIEGGSRVTLAVENRGDQPLRVIDLAVSALDRQGFVQKPTTAPDSEVTVPPRAKEKVSFDLSVAAKDVGAVRAWDADLPMPTTP